ncbi:sulfotransferase [Methylocaldum sp.]|uniref:sulfotransferase n=1 Tax=Methylocaldum sp. TaxID=1969727 RepID=UPI002D56192E|nr:sulfotransferase [Methylocaldum sp.]HYE37886.1 sulfotransferase [Methylocaldum sp.]
MLQYITSALKGPAQARAAHRQALLRKPGIGPGIEALLAACPPVDADDDEAPIFLLSAGWRSGSTLLQRLIMSDKNVLIWGEPYDECGMIQALAETTKAFRAGWPPSDYFYDGTPPNELSGAWIANLFPSLEDLRKGHRALFDTMFAQPTKAAGASRWGIKEVRLGMEHSVYLRWLYPKARFLFLYRNPFEAYRSYCRYGRSWYDIFPDKPVFTPMVFGSHWRNLMEGFIRDSDKLGALLVRYEDLIAGKAHLDEIEAYLGIHIDRGVLNAKVGSSERDGEKAKVSRFERWLLKRAVSPVAEELGYY